MNWKEVRKLFLRKAGRKAVLAKGISAKALRQAESGCWVQATIRQRGIGEAGGRQQGPGPAGSHGPWWGLWLLLQVGWELEVTEVAGVKVEVGSPVRRCMQRPAPREPSLPLPREQNSLSGQLRVGGDWIPKTWGQPSPHVPSVPAL